MCSSIGYTLLTTICKGESAVKIRKRSCMLETSGERTNTKLVPLVLLIEFEMKHELLLGIIILIVIDRSVGLFPNSLVNSFLSYKIINRYIIINCETMLNNIYTYKSLEYKLGNIYNVEGNLEQILSSVSNIESDTKTGIVLDLDCPNSLNLLFDMSSIFTLYNNTLFNSMFYWFLLAKERRLNNANLENIVSELNVNIDSEMYLAVYKDEEECNIFEVYNTGKHHFGSWVIAALGSWSASKGLMLSQEYKYQRRSNMTGVVLKCMNVVTNELHNRTFSNYIVSSHQRHIDSMNRFNFALMSYVKEMFNFSFAMYRTHSWGYLTNGTFNGLVGQLERRLMDVGGSPIFFRLERAKVVDYTIQTWISRPCFIFRHPKRTTNLFEIYIHPFEDSVWYCAVAVTIFLSIFMYIFLHIEFYSQQESNMWSQSVLNTIGVVFQQGIPLQMRLSSSKLMLISHLIFAILLYQYYSASIVSSLLMKTPKTIKTLQDLLKSDLKAGLEDIPYNLDYFKRTDDAVALKLYRSKISTAKYKHIYEATKGLNKVKKGGFAFHIDTATAYPIISDTFTEDEVCGLAEIQLFPPQKSVAILQKGSPFRKLFSYGLRKTVECGLMKKQEQIWHAPRPKCIERPDTEKLKVTLKEFSPVMIILAVGMLLSLFIFLAEICYYKNK